jgi:hypothetical protein
MQKVQKKKLMVSLRHLIVGSKILVLANGKRLLNIFAKQMVKLKLLNLLLKLPLQPLNVHSRHRMK